MGAAMKTLPWGIVLWVTLAGQVALADEKPKPWESIALTSQESRVKDCEYLEDVTGSAPWNVFPAKSERLAKKRIMKRAYEVGANTVLIVDSSATRYTGEAYICNAAPAPSTQAPAATPAPGGGGR